MKKRREGDKPEEKKERYHVFYFDCSCGLTVTADTMEEVQGRAISHQLSRHRLSRPESQLRLVR